MLSALMLATAIAVSPVQVSNQAIGYAVSSYQGDWYSPKWEDVRKCIMYHESRYNYKAANKTSSARGAYQFLDLQWRDGLVWMMLDEGGDTKEIKSLRDVPINEWNRYYQDRAFFTAWRHGEGKKHWSLQAHRCY
jgi:hypothetical protein